MNTWYITADSNKYDHSAAFTDWGYLDWVQYGDYKIGDVVVFNSSTKDTCIKFKTSVEKINMKYSETQYNKSYWRITPESILEDMMYCRLKLIQRVYRD